MKGGFRGVFVSGLGLMRASELGRAESVDECRLHKGFEFRA